MKSRLGRMGVQAAHFAIVVVVTAGFSTARSDELAKDQQQYLVPLTREDMKRALEDSKRVIPRLPLPPLTDEEKARIEDAARAQQGGGGVEKGASRSGLGQGIVNNARMRSYYLADYNAGRTVPGKSGPGARTGAAGLGVGFGREPEPGMSLGYPFLTQLFWIVSRANNCTYCMGHQEAKLASAGFSDDEIAALDGDWLELDAAKRAAFTFTKKLTHQPHLMGDQDISALREHYDDNQITEMILAIAGFNAMNRWTGPLRIPQEERHEFLKPTSSKYINTLTHVAPVAHAGASGGFAPAAPRDRPALESRDEVEAALSAAQHRAPRIRIADISVARTLMKSNGTDEPPQWVRLLAVFPRAGAVRVTARLAAEERGSLDARTKAVIAWVAARHDRAWYALAHARKRLQQLGFSEDTIFVLDDPGKVTSEKERALIEFTRKITVDPAIVTDDDFKRMRSHFSDQQVAEIVYQITEAASFDRITEAAGLAIEQ